MLQKILQVFIFRKPEVKTKVALTPLQRKLLLLEVRKLRELKNQK